MGYLYINDEGQLVISFSDVGIFSEKDLDIMNIVVEALNKEDILFMRSDLKQQFQDGGMPTGMWEDYLKVEFTIFYKNDIERVKQIVLPLGIK
jgi:hypothetical protein